MSGRLVFTTLPPEVGFEGVGEVLDLFIGIGSVFSSSCALGGRMQGVVKGGFVSRSSLCSTLVDGGGCWLTELSTASLEGSMRSIISPPSLVCAGAM